MATIGRRSAYEPVAWHVPRWTTAPFTGGAWATLGPGGTSVHRAQLGEPIDGRVVLCGDATSADAPSMVHGAVAEGRRGAQWAIDRGARCVIVVGAGAAGLAAAGELVGHGVSVTVLEARHRAGGRVHTVSMGGRVDGSAVQADAGAAWLQQWPANEVARHVDTLGARTVGTDFVRSLSAAPLAQPGSAIESSVTGALSAVQRCAASLPAAASMADVVESLGPSLDESGRRALWQALGVDLELEHGVALDDWGVRSLDEGGVGNGDRWLVDGYAPVILAMSGAAEVQFGRAVRALAWDASGVQVSHEAVDAHGTAVGADATDVADACVCTVPAWLLQRLRMSPGLPALHSHALSMLHPARVEKVLMRFDERWWPPSLDGRVLRWYDEPPGWGEWFDLTDGLGVPVVAGFCAGTAVDRLVVGQTDAEVIKGAVDALRRFSAALH